MTFSTLHALALAALGGLAIVAGAATRAEAASCPVSSSELRKALVKADEQDETGLNNHFWAVVVDRTGVICAVAFSGDKPDSQWLLSRQIAAAKAFTANGLSLDSAPISTSQLYPWVQGSPSGGNPLFGLAFGNPLDAGAVYDGGFGRFGTDDDPMLGKRLGGTITFGGGVGLYDGKRAIGGLGLSGDTACADHSTAWRTRLKLKLAPSEGNDRLTFDNVNGHPHCPNDAATQGVN